MFLLFDSWVKAVLFLVGIQSLCRVSSTQQGLSTLGHQGHPSGMGWQEVTPLHLALNRNWLTLLPAGVVGAMCAPRCYSLHK